MVIQVAIAGFVQARADANEGNDGASLSSRSLRETLPTLYRLLLRTSPLTLSSDSRALQEPGAC